MLLLPICLLPIKCQFLEGRTLPFCSQKYSKHLEQCLAYIHAQQIICWMNELVKTFHDSEFCELAYNSVLSLALPIMEDEKRNIRSPGPWVLFQPSTNSHNDTDWACRPFCAFALPFASGASFLPNNHLPLISGMRYVLLNSCLPYSSLPNQMLNKVNENHSLYQGESSFLSAFTGVDQILWFLLSWVSVHHRACIRIFPCTLLAGQHVTETAAEPHRLPFSCRIHLLLTVGPCPKRISSSTQWRWRLKNCHEG